MNNNDIVLELRNLLIEASKEMVLSGSLSTSKYEKKIESKFL